MDHRYDVLDDAARLSREFVDGLAERHAGATATVEELYARLNRPLTEAGEDPRTVVAELARDVEPGLIASAGPRYFGFVIGGALPAAVAADWLTSAWDQNAGGTPVAPALVVAEEVAAGWLRELLGLPATCGVGFVTGCQMAHVTCLAAARHAVLADAGWDVEADGLQGAPALRVLAGANAHVTIARACRLLGLGADRIRVVPADGEGRMIATELDAALAERPGGAQIVCAQAGEVNSGAFDPLAEIVAVCREHGAWCHVDGAFGLWAAASPSRRGLLDGHAGADSWATDGHKWLNVPYDCGIAIVADPARQHGAMSMAADYIPPLDEVPWGVESTPEFSRRARGIPLYAALRALGRDGVADLVDRCCEHARHMAGLLSAADGVEVLNDVVLNQVLVRFGDDDAHTDAVIERVQAEGTCWASGSRWHGRAVMRVSVIGWQTTAADIERSAAAILAAASS
jgi:glutamate/tyrosine decarboxylase-like PLP-dependent enzyme